MTFDDITGDRKLWAVHFEGEDDNELYKVFNNWADVVWLRAFFKENIDDLNAYFKITDIKEAISDTIEDSERLRYIIMDISPETDLSKALTLVIGTDDKTEIDRIKKTIQKFVV